MAERIAKSFHLVGCIDHRPLVFDTYAVWPTAPSMPARLRILVDTLALRLPGMTGADREIEINCRSGLLLKSGQPREAM